MDMIIPRLMATSVVLGLLGLVLVMFGGAALGWYTPYDARYAVVICFSMIVLPIIISALYIIWGSP